MMVVSDTSLIVYGGYVKVRHRAAAQLDGVFLWEVVGCLAPVTYCTRTALAALLPFYMAFRSC